MTHFDSFTHDSVHGYRFGHQAIGKPRMLVYVYYVDGLLIDTGQSSMRKKILEVTQELPVDQILVTHHHEDHSGNILALKQQHNCPVYAPPLCCEMMKNPAPISWAQKLTWGDRPAYHDLTPIEREIQTKHHTFQIIPIPGHASDMAALYEPERKWLFSADLFINSYISFTLHNESIKDQIESIRRILKLEFDVMFCSHNPKLDDPKKSLRKKLNFFEELYSGVERLHAKGYSPKAIFRELKLREDWVTRLLSGGDLSKMNMVRSAIRDLEG